MLSTSTTFYPSMRVDKLQLVIILLFIVSQFISIKIRNIKLQQIIGSAQQIIGISEA